MIKYIELGLNDLGEMIYGRVDEDGLIRVTCIGSDAGYQAWLNPKAEQSTPNLAE